MTHPRLASPTTVAVLLVLLVGCSRIEPAAAPVDPFPPRPESLKISTLPACDAVDPRQAAEVDINDRTSDVLKRGENTCSLGAGGRQIWTVRIYPGVPARSYVPGDPNFVGDDLGLVEPRVTTVDGYGAVEVVNGMTASNYNCSVVVDAEPDASFLVSYEVTSQLARTRTVGSRAEGCARASRVASMVIATARSRS